MIGVVRVVAAVAMLCLAGSLCVVAVVVAGDADRHD